MPQPLRLARYLPFSSLLLLCLVLAVAAVGLLSPLGCTSATQTRVQCELDAVVQVLPRDPDQLTLGDLKDVAHRLRDCQAAEPRPEPPAPDAGG